MSEIKVNNIQSSSGTNGPVVSGITTMASSGAMSLPRGDTAYRGGRGRGIFGGGTPTPGSRTNLVDYITIASTGNALDFGDLINALEQGGTVASSTRGIYAGGNDSPTFYNVISYVTIQSTGNSFDFGDLSKVVTNMAGVSNNTRGILAGGEEPSTLVNTNIQYLTIASKGDTTLFGELTTDKNRTKGSFGSPTRGVICGGQDSPGAKTNACEYLTISTLGNTQDFGDLSTTRAFIEGCSNSTRGLVGGGENPGYTDIIEYVTIASTGDFIDFGNLQTAKSVPGACASTTRGIWAGGASPARLTEIDYVEISTLGNGQDFGDLTVGRYYCKGLSDVHGGLG